MEIWDLYDEYKNKLNETHIRGKELPNNKYHLVVHVWIKNKDGKYLISKRSKNRKTFPGYWETTGGSVLKDENSLEASTRESFEELGILLDSKKGKLIKTNIRKIINGKKFNDIVDIYLFEYNGEVNLEKATTDEVEDYTWATKEDIKILFEKGIFVKTLDYFFDLF